MPSIAERIDAAVNRLTEKSDAEQAEVMAAIGGLKTEVQNLKDALGAISPEAEAALGRLDARVEKVSDIFTPDATEPPTEPAE